MDFKKIFLKFKVKDINYKIMVFNKIYYFLNPSDVFFVQRCQALASISYSSKYQNKQNGERYMFMDNQTFIGCCTFDVH